jgi:hypothetical protein
MNYYYYQELLLDQKLWHGRRLWVVACLLVQGIAQNHQLLLHVTTSSKGLTD